MKFRTLLLMGLLVVTTSSYAFQIKDILKKASKTVNGSSLSESEIAEGLKEALIKGIEKGSDLASKVDGYFGNPSIKLPFPPDAQKAEATLRNMGMNDEVDRFILTLNRGAEKAASEAKDIFVDAIKAMTINDAVNILKGEDDAATQFLKRTTSDQLFAKFLPVIKKALEEVNATKYYSDLVTTYNKIPLVKKVDPNLDEYATNKAIDGLFYLIAQEEARIRKDPLARTTEILKKVFKEQD